MKLILSGDDASMMRDIQAELGALVAEAGLAEALQAGPVTAEKSAETERGDPVTLFTVALVAVGAGGALTVALSKGGFLTQLARVLEKYIESGQIRAWPGRRCTWWKPEGGSTPASRHCGNRRGCS